MNILLYLGLSSCILVAYATALPYPSEVPENKPDAASLVVADTKSEGETLVPAESAWSGRGSGNGGRGLGFGGGLGGGGGWRGGRGWGGGLGGGLGIGYGRGRGG